MKKSVLLILCFLVACAPVSEPVAEPVPEAEPPAVQPPVQKEDAKFEPATRTVKQSGSLGTFIYGLAEDNRVVSVDKTGAAWKFVYENGRLVEITGPQNIEFLYERGKLTAIDSGASKLMLKYDARERLVEVKGGQQTLYIDYNTLDLVRSVKRNAVVSASFDYDDKGVMKSLSRGPILTGIFFDDRGRVRNFDADDTKFILGYWRDDKLISLTGKTFGQGLAVSYGPDYPPFRADVKSEGDDSTFTAAYTDTLYAVVDEYLYCKYIRRLKDVLFDGISYVFFVSYFKGDLADYIAMQFRCVPYEA
jgi:hypothetical protein